MASKRPDIEEVWFRFRSYSQLRGVFGYIRDLERELAAFHAIHPNAVAQRFETIHAAINAPLPAVEFTDE